jgi:hypothetical protein
MNNWKKVIVLSGLCSCALSVNAMASTNLETGSSLAGISVALNNYYAGNTEPEKQLASSYSNIQNKSAQSNTAAGSARAAAIRQAASPAARQETPVRQRLPRRPRPNQSPRRMTTLPCPR